MSEFRRRLQFKQESELGEKVYFWRRKINNSYYIAYSTNPEGESWTGALTLLPVYSYTSLLSKVKKLDRNTENCFQYSTMSYSSGIYTGTSSNGLNNKDINPAGDGNYGWGMYCYSPLDNAGNPTAYTAATNWSSTRLAINISISSQYVSMVECFSIQATDDRYDLRNNDLGKSNYFYSISQSGTITNPQYSITTPQSNNEILFINFGMQVYLDSAIWNFMGGVYWHPDLTNYNWIHLNMSSYRNNTWNSNVYLVLTQTNPGTTLNVIATTTPIAQYTTGSSASPNVVDAYIPINTYSGSWYVFLGFKNKFPNATGTFNAQSVISFGEFELI